MDRITSAHLNVRLASLNDRMETRDSKYRYEIQQRNGRTCIDRTSADSREISSVHSMVKCGTKREIAEWLYAATTVLDDTEVS